MRIRCGFGKWLAVASATLVGFTVAVATANAQQSTGTSTVRRLTAPPPESLTLVDGAAVPADAPWHSLAHPSAPAIPGYSHFVERWPGSGVYQAADGAYWVDDTFLYGEQAEADSGQLNRLPMADDTQSDDTGGQAPYGPESLWAEALAATNDSVTAAANLVIHPPDSELGGVFDVFYTASLEEPRAWYWVYRTVPFETNLWATGLSGLNSGFFLIADTNGPADASGLTAACMALVGPSALTNDIQGTGIPDIWQVLWLGGLHPANYSADGVRTIYACWQFGLDPNPISFNLLPFNDHITNSTVILGLNVLAGLPVSSAIVIDTNDTSAAVWQPFQTNVLANLGASEGWHDVLIGARGRMETSQQTFQWTRVKVDRTPPPLVIDSLPGLTDQAFIQIRGYAPEALAQITLSNAATATEQAAFIVGQYYSTNTWEITTNWFQAFNVPLVNGQNSFTLRAVDLAGNLGTTNFTVTFDPFSNSNAPVVSITWPADGMVVGSSDLNCFGTVDNPSATITAVLEDGAGETNTASAEVETDGRFWLDHLTLGAGTNTLIVTATSPAGVSNVLGLSVVRGPVDITVADIPGDDLNQPPIYVGGTVSTNGYAVNVNGVDATMNPLDGTQWSAEGVPLDPGTTAVVMVHATPQVQDPSMPPEDYAVVGVRPPRLYPAHYQLSQDSQTVACGTNSFPEEEPAITGTSEEWADQLPGWSKGYITWPNGGWMDDNGEWPGAWWPLMAQGTNITTGPGLRWDQTNSTQGSVAYEHWNAKPRPRYDHGAWGFNQTRNADTVMGFFTGGRACSGEELLFIFSATMTDYGSDGQATPVSVQPEEIEIDGVGRLDADGLKYAKLPAGATVYPTPRSDAAKNETFAEPLPPNPEPQIWFRDKNVTDKKTVVWVGETMNPSLQFDFNPPDPVTNYLWSVPGSAYSNILYSSSLGIAPPLTYTNRTNSSVTFYWTEGMPLAEVSCQAVVRGTTNTAKTYFEVRKPDVSWSLTPKYPVGIYSNYYGGSGFWLACGLGHDTNDCGMLFEFNVLDLKGYMDYYVLQFVQLRSLNTWENFLSNTNLHRCINTNGLDAVYPYTGWEMFPPVIFRGYPTNGNTHDSPGHSLTDRYLVSQAESFQSYLLFWPTGGKPVPLKLAPWNWGGQATAVLTNSPPTYTLNSPVDPAPATGTACSVPPTWTNYISPDNLSTFWRTNDCPNP